MKNPEEVARQVFGQRALYYTTSATHTDPQVLAKVVELSSPRSDWWALDVATGTGHTAFAMAPHVAYVIGVDLTPQMLAEAKQLRRDRSIANVDLHLADVHHLPFDEGAFDLVTCRRAAHHFSHLAQSLQEMRRVLRPGGRLVIDDRSVPEDDFLDACMNELDRYHDESHRREYRPSEWAQMLEGLGFVMEEVEPYIQHRPVTSLTEGASPDNVQKIHQALAGLDASQKEALNFVEIDGMPYFNHWYVVLSARRG